MAKKALTLRQYEDNAHSTITNSTSDYLDKILGAELIGILRRYVAISRTIDTYKKAAFYGRDIDTYPTPVQVTDRKGLGFALIHGVLGIAGEAGEVVEIMLDVLDGKITIEEARPMLTEELGDLLWYLTVAARDNDPEGGLETVGIGNNTKLAERWGDKISQGATDFKT